MGAVRLLLALALVLTHTEAFMGREFTVGFNAVQVFFSVSGLFIAMVLSQKYAGPGGWKAFYKARLLRIFPVYWMVLLCTLAVYLGIYLAMGSKTALASWTAYGSRLDPVALAAVVWANLGLLGQSLLFFSAVDPQTGSLFFTVDPSAQVLPAWTFLLVPQAWFLDFMFWLYLVAPPLSRLKTPALLLLALAGLSARVWVEATGLPVDPWIMRFAPFELAFFILGMLCWRIVDAVDLSGVANSLKWAAAVGYGAFFLGLELLEGEFVRSLTSITLLILGAPFIFSLTRHSRLDRLLGEWSLLVFLIHGTVINAVVALGGRRFLTPLVVLASLVLAWLLTSRVIPRLPGMSARSPALPGPRS